MDKQSSPTTRRPWQFSLGSLLLAVVFLALACAAGKYFIDLNGDLEAPPDRMREALSLFAVPILLCAAIGTLFGYLTDWLVLGIVLSFAVLLLLPAVS